MIRAVKSKPAPHGAKCKPPSSPRPAWKVGDWVVFDLDIGQIKEIRDATSVSLSNGFIESSGNLFDRFRAMTLKSKRIVETFSIYYNRLKDIDGNSGFNYPDISQYFASLALQAIDEVGGEVSNSYDKARNFIAAAHDYTPSIDGIRLFRRA